jgi:glycosyltransferase involved in cell wall biosynthesis
MIRIAHLLSGIHVGGSEQMVLEFCKHRDRTQFECVVAAPVAGVIADEMRRTGTSVYIGPTALRDAVREADLINLHWWDYEPSMLALVQAAARPYVITLHCPIRLPKLPVVTICTGEYAYEVQEHKAHCVVIPNGVDLSRFAPPCERQREEVILTRVCRPPRCALYFWAAIKQILNRYSQTRLWIVGNDNENCRSDSDRVCFLGLRRDIPEILAETDIFVYTPYPRRGTRDLVVMEASAAGVPCVVSNVNTVCTSVEDGVNGFLTPFGAEKEFVEKVGLLVEDAALRARMSRAAVQIARERFDIRDVVRRYEAVYRAVLDTHQPCCIEGEQYRPSN